MEEKDKIIVKWAQEDVETSNNLLNNNNNNNNNILIFKFFDRKLEDKRFCTE